jgi:hypothetical protein
VPKRKAAAAELSEDQGDSLLAQSLLDVLQKFQHDRQAAVTPSNPQKKGKGGPTPKPDGSKLARILLQTIQSALTQGWSDEVVAQRLINKISRHAPPMPEPQSESKDDPKGKSTETAWSSTKQQLGELLHTKVAKHTPEHAGKVTGMLLERPVAEVQSFLRSDQLLSANVKEALQCLRVSDRHVTASRKQTWVDKVKDTKSPNQGKSTKGLGKTKSDLANTRFAVKIKPSEWKHEPVITSLPQIQRALTAGEEVPGNLIVCNDANVVTEAKNLWNAFGCSAQKLTVATVNQKPCAAPSVCVWWSHGKTNTAGPQRIQLDIVQMTEGPVPRPAVVTTFPKPEGPKMVTVRFLTRVFSRKFIPGVIHDDTPKTVIASWAASAGIQFLFLLEANGRLPLTTMAKSCWDTLKLLKSFRKLLTKSSRSLADKPYMRR